MQRSLRSLYLFPAVLAVGCAGAPHNVTYNKPSQTQVVCLKEPATGTRVLQRRCYSKASLDKIRQESQLWLRTNGRMGGIMMVRERPDPK